MSEQATPVSAADQAAAMVQLVSTPPPWLTQDYFKAALQEYEKDKALEITSFSIVPAGKPGDNFASIVFRTTVSYKSRGKERLNVSYIVKVEPFVEGFQKEMMGCGSQFETEIAMYTKTLPAMQHLLKGSGDEEILAPELIFASLEPKIIILPDITPDQYVTEKQPQNYDTVSKVFKKLAKFHALSYFLLNDQHDETITNYTEPFISEKMNGGIQFVLQTFGLAIQILKGWGKEMELVADRLLAMQPTLIPKVLAMYQPNPLGFNVLNHGDFHIRNLMFKWNGDPEKIVESIKFIDFQFCFYGSPAVDIFWTLYFVASTETRDNHREDLIKLYHEEFVATLTKLGYLKNPPTLLDLNIELLKHGILEAFAVLGPLPIFFLDMQELMAQAKVQGAPTMEDMMVMGKQLMEAPPMKEIVTKLVSKLLYQGNFEA